MVRIGVMAVGLCAVFTCWAVEEGGAAGGPLEPGRGSFLSKQRATVEEAQAETLQETVAGVHAFMWGPLEDPPWDPERYVARVLALPRMEKLVHIAQAGTDEERTELLAAVDEWMDSFLHDYPLVNFIGDTEYHAGLSALNPGMSPALTLLLADLDPSPTSLRRIVKAYDRHVEALHYSHERKGLVKPENDDGEVRSPTTNVFGIAAIHLVEKAHEKDEDWLHQDESVLQDFVVGLEVVRSGERKLVDVVAVIDVARSSLEESEE